MTAARLDGTAMARELRAGFASRVERLAAAGVRPGLAVILVGDDPASQVYVRNKVQACEAIGIRSDRFVFAADAAPAEVLDRIGALNADPQVHGILVQLPLPKHFDEQQVLEVIGAEKDVDGFHRDNVGALSQGRPRFVPCTPRGVLAMLDAAGVELRGKEAVVVGRSNIVGKPMAQLLTARDATVTVCHSRTADLATHTRRADVLVVAAGRPRMVTADMIKPGAVVVDVGIHRGAEGRLCGDVDYDGCRTVASLISPVPGGVGPMTITMLLGNTLDAAERRAALG
ncbi:MAG: bifunctional methylenetetrahydrofolate dehydrogenase/methenyltetrahydrofolate cyclohydrolase FolD [Burkholderiaceae bacterium]|nr:bifunctional methylenetetrahydrofolate dehydrogenase/methenyltetrahydrofolate cyclohydrolase FolD [Burkholderiaceae bacterium]